MEALGRIHWEEDAAGRLMVLDCSNNTSEEAEAVFVLFDAAVRAEPEGSVRLLADFENAFHSPALTRRWKEASHAHDRHVRKAALVGISGGIKVVIMAYRFYLRLRGIDVDNKMRLFDDEAAARAWLAEA